MDDDDKANYGFCHHCKQMKNRFVLAKCNYDSQKMGYTIPNHYSVKDVKIYNSKDFHLLSDSYHSLPSLVDIGNKASYNYLVKYNMGRYNKTGQVPPFVASPESFHHRRETKPHHHQHSARA